MRISYYRRANFPVDAANAVNTFRLCEAFALAGHAVTLHIPWYDPSIDLFDYYGVERNFLIQPLAKRSGYLGRGLLLALRLAIALKKTDADFVYGRDYYTAGWLSFIGKAHYFDAHGPVPQRSGIHGLLISKAFSNRWLKGITVISEALGQLIKRDVNLSSPLRVVRNASKDILANATPAGISRSVADRPLNVTYVGGFYPGRGIDVLLAAAQRLPEVKFTLVGGDSQGGTESEHAESRANVEYPGYVAAREVIRYYSTADVLVAPYQKKVAYFGGGGDAVNYMSPVKIFEYMSAARAMIVSDLPAIREILSDKEAVFCSPDAVDEWVSAIELLRSDLVLREQLATAAYDYFRANYTWPERVANILALKSS